LLTRDRRDKATDVFNRHGGKIIGIARFVEGLRQANGIIAVTTGMRWRRFLVFNAIGAALWVAVWSGVGYLSGNHINTVYDDASRYSTWLGIGAATILVSYLIGRRAVRRRDDRPALRPGARTPKS
jgi:membrane protein DedA with SNARE-associated domain